MPYLQPDRTSTDAVRLRVSPVNDQRAVADHANTVAQRQDLELVPVVLHTNAHNQLANHNTGTIERSQSRLP